LICTEAMDPEGVGYVAEVADIIQIGARNMQNFSLLKAAGRAKKPVLLKRGMAATIEELLLSAEYLLAEGNHAVILCERGIRGCAARWSRWRGPPWRPARTALSSRSIPTPTRPSRTAPSRSSPTNLRS